jgi:hypothetical protein
LPNIAKKVLENVNLGKTVKMVKQHSLREQIALRRKEGKVFGSQSKPESPANQFSTRKKKNRKLRGCV